VLAAMGFRCARKCVVAYVRVARVRACGGGVAAVCARVALAEVSICRIYGMFWSELAAGFPNSG
jgi:hypothetical protein